MQSFGFLAVQLRYSFIHVFVFVSVALIRDWCGSVQPTVSSLTPRRVGLSCIRQQAETACVPLWCLLQFRCEFLPWLSPHPAQVVCEL